MNKTDTATIIGSLRILAQDIESDDGIANMAIAEAADRMEELQNALDAREKQYVELHARYDELVAEREASNTRTSRPTLDHFYP